MAWFSVKNTDKTPPHKCILKSMDFYTTLEIRLPGVYMQKIHYHHERSYNHQVYRACYNEMLRAAHRGTYTDELS